MSMEFKEGMWVSKTTGQYLDFPPPPAEAPDAGFIKHDQGKDPWHLIPWDALREVTKVLAYGAKKYSPNNWCKGADWHRYQRAAMEHLISWSQGEDKDPDTGLNHLAHCMCCILFLLAYQIRGIGRDTRKGE